MGRNFPERSAILEGLRELPAFPDVMPGLERLRSWGYQLIVLTNSRKKAAKKAVEFAGLSRLFHAVLSSEDAKRLKTAPEPYLIAAKKAGTKPRNLLLVAAHSWDVAGAQSASSLRLAGFRAPRLAHAGPELTPEATLQSRGDVIRDALGTKADQRESLANLFLVTGTVNECRELFLLHL